MPHVQVETERVIAARPEVVYQRLADYREARPRMLTPNFENYAVAKGGQGNGTVVTYVLHAGRRQRPYEMHVSEEGKPRSLVEKDAKSSLVTRWRVAPAGDSAQSRVSVATEWEGGSGIGGFFERTFAPMGLRRIYNTMLDNLAQEVTSGRSS